MKVIHKELLLYSLVWAFVVGLTLIFWSNDDPEIPIAFNIPNILYVLLLYIVYLFGLWCLRKAHHEIQNKYQKQYQVTGFLLAMAAFCGLATIFYFLMIGLLFAILVSTFLDYIRPNFAWFLAISAPLLSGLYDVVCKNMGFYLEIKILYIAINSLVLLFCTKIVSETQAKEHSKKLLRELQATQLLLTSTTKRDERLRISRDLHDTLGHKLTALKLQLEIANHATGEKKDKAIKLAQNIGGEFLDDIRQNVSEFRESNDLELDEIIATLIRDIPNVNFEVNNESNGQSLTTRQAETIFRCIQESITNLLKHGNATECLVEIKETPSNLQLRIQDNGTPLETHFEAGNGLKGMQERVTTLDGIFQSGFNQKGFEVKVSLPLNLVH